MRILRININSFGNVKGWTSGDLRENVTLFTGANETGKTTTMEFIRSTLFPGRKSRYPSADRNDSGTLIIVMDDGDERMLVRKGRKVTEAKGKPLPSDELSIDAETYRSIFAMDLEQVANSKILTSDDFRNRFLTVPGGEEIPRISEDIEKRMLEIMNRSRISDRNEMGSLLSEIDRIEEETAAIEAKSDEYDKLVAERDELSRSLAGMKKKQELRRNEEGRNMVIMSQKKNVESLKELYRRREDLEYSREMPENARDEYNKLEMRLAATRIIDIDTSPEELPEALSGRKPKDILERQEEIENAWAVRLKVEVKEQMRATLEETAESSQQLVEDYTQATGWSEKAEKGPQRYVHIEYGGIRHNGQEEREYRSGGQEHHQGNHDRSRSDPSDAQLPPVPGEPGPQIHSSSGRSRHHHNRYAAAGDPGRKGREEQLRGHDGGRMVQMDNLRGISRKNIP